MPLSEFQVVTEHRLRALLESRSRSLEGREIAGQSELYIKATISSTPLEVFVYEDEAQVLGPGVEKIFEAPDFSDGEALRNAFLSAVASLLEREWSVV